MIYPKFNFQPFEQLIPPLTDDIKLQSIHQVSLYHQRFIDWNNKSSLLMLFLLFFRSRHAFSLITKDLQRATS